MATFTDVPASGSLTPSINWVTKQGIMPGITSTQFRPGTTLTRVAAAETHDRQILRDQGIDHQLAQLSMGIGAAETYEFGVRLAAIDHRQHLVEHALPVTHEQVYRQSAPLLCGHAA